MRKNAFAEAYFLEI